jgi:hypothetical protein
MLTTLTSYITAMMMMMMTGEVSSLTGCLFCSTVSDCKIPKNDSHDESSVKLHDLLQVSSLISRSRVSAELTRHIHIHIDIEGKIKGRIEVTRRRGRRRKHLLDNLGDRRGYSHLKEEALDRVKWRNRFGRGCGPVVCLTDY